MDNLKELCKQIELCFNQNKEQFYQYSEICRLINAIADLSSSRIARALDYTIKEIAYASVEPNFEIRKKYLSEAIRDLLSGMNETDVLLKYEDILYRMKGWY